MYHNLNHTKSVVNMAKKLGVESGLDESRLELLLSAAWFHDCGYINGGAEGHEERSCILVDEELSDYFTDLEREKIKNAIKATEWPQNPSSNIGELLADADVHTLGTKEFDEVEAQIFLELRQTSHPNLNRDQFIEARLDMFLGYEFHTAIGREYFQQDKDKNIARMFNEWRFVIQNGK